MSLDLLESFDRFSPLRNKLREVAAEEEEWAGIPMPLEGERLVVEPTYPFAALGDIGKPEPGPPDPDGLRLRNQWWSDARRATIYVMEDKDGRVSWGLRSGIHHLGQDVHTLGCADAWGVEQEAAAVRLLGEQVSHRQFKHYLLTGMFLETSARSRVTYLFRRLRPTVALVEHRGEMRILAALCLHPIAYYGGTWAGAMCPTDDVLAHLVLMRGDEALYWKRSNQHHPVLPEAGL